MSYKPPLINLTQKAAEYIEGLFKEKGITSRTRSIRFRIKTGGCHGLECIHELEQAEKHGDMIVISHGIRVLIGPESLNILRGTTIDHSDNLLDKPFIFNNDNFKPPCGYGSSFELKDKENPA